MNLLGKAMEKNFWKEVREKDCYRFYRDELMDMWQKNCENKPILALTYSDFKRFWTSGNRSIYEDAYFLRRRAAYCAALLSLVYPENEIYPERLMDQLFAICDEYTWCLPAHQGKLETPNSTRIDIFAAETGYALSEIYTLLEDRLEPLIRERIRTELDRRVIAPFSTVDNYGWWENGTHTLTGVCISSMAGTVMLMRPDLMPRLLPRFERGIAGYLSGIREDGICTAGCHYWNYGFGYFTAFADMLRTFTDGEVDYFRLPKVRAIASFIQKAFLSGDAGVSFSDSGRTAQYQLGLMHYLKNEYPDDIVVPDPKYSYNYDNCGRFCLHLRSALWLDEDLISQPAPKADILCYAPESQWFVKTTDFYGFAAKGGHNDEQHNHNDVGTFIFAKNGQQVLTDLGSGLFTRQYFAPDTRYSVLEASSRGHNVPIVGGNCQREGEEAAARNTRYENGIFSLDIADAYPGNELQSLCRSFAFTDETVTLKDEFVYTGEGDIVDRFVTLFPPVIQGNTVTAGDTVLTFDTALCTAEIHSEIRQREDTCYFIDFRLKPGIRSFVCVIR